MRDGNANMSVRNEIKAGEKANKFYRPKRPKRYCFTVLCPPFLNLKEFLARRREDCLSFPVWWQVSQGKFFFNESCSKIPNELTLSKIVSANYGEQVCRPLFILASG